MEIESGDNLDIFPKVERHPRFYFPVWQNLNTVFFPREAASQVLSPSVLFSCSLFLSNTWLETGIGVGRFTFPLQTL